MAEILLVNPKRRRKKGRRMSALQRKYFGKRRTRAASPRRRRRRSRSSAVIASNPRRRRRRHTRAVRSANPRKRRSRRTLTRSVRRRRHRNPSLRGALGSFMPVAKAGFIGATGAIGLDFAWGYGKQYLPAAIAGSPMAQYAAKLLGAILIGVIGNKLPFLRGRGRDLAVGASTVVLHDAMKAQIQASFPGAMLGEYLTYAPTVGHMNRAGR
jgi:hypothetical protein